MKKLVLIGCLLLTQGCILAHRHFVNIYIDNNSNEAIYVYIKCGDVDSLPLYPKLHLTRFLNNEGLIVNAWDLPFERGFVLPEYEINAHSRGALRIAGANKRSRLPCDGNKATFFFITERTMRNKEWEEIYAKQMFEQRVVLTEEELKKNSWIYTYEPTP